MTKYLADLRSKKQSLWDASKAILDAADRAGRDLTAAEQTRFDSLTGDMDAVGQRINDETDRIESERTITGYLDNALGTPDSAVFGSAKPWLPSGRAYHEALAEQRSTGYSAASGVLLTDTFGQWFDRLRARSVFLQAGPRLVPVPGHAVSVPVVASSASIAATAENADIAASDPDIDGIVLTPKKYAGIVHVSNEVLSDSSPAARDIVSADLMRTTAAELDKDLLRGAGTSGTIKGLTKITGTTPGPSLGTNGAVPTLDDLLSMIGSLDAAGGDLSRAAFFIGAELWAVLRGTHRGTSDLAYVVDPGSTAGPRPTLWNVPIFSTGHLPQDETVGTATTASTVVLADLDQLAVGVGQDVAVAISDQFKFGSDQSSIRVTARFDVAAINPAAVVVMPGALTEAA